MYTIIYNRSIYFIFRNQLLLCIGAQKNSLCKISLWNHFIITISQHFFFSLFLHGIQKNHENVKSVTVIVLRVR